MKDYQQHDLDTLHDAMSELDGFYEDMIAYERNHRQHVTELLLSFVRRNADRTVTAADICGTYWWENFTEDEQRRAEDLIGQLVIELNLPLSPTGRQRDSEPHRYTLTR